MVCPHGQRGVEPVWTFCGHRGGVNFSRFCADVFYGRHLTAFLIDFTGTILALLIPNDKWQSFDENRTRNVTNSDMVTFGYRIKQTADQISIKGI